MNIKENLNLFYKLANCNYNLYFWVYDTDMTLVSTTCPDLNLLDKLLIWSGSREYLLAHIPDDFSPLMLGDFLGLMWIVVFETENDAVRCIHIMGPAFINERSFSVIESKLNQRDMPVSIKMNLLKCLRELPLIPSMIYFQYALMFHRCISEKPLDISDISLVRKEKLPDAADTGIPENRHIGAWDTEQEIKKIIRDGNLNYESTLSRAAAQFPGIKASLGDSIRHAKDTLIVFTTICTREAISGGLSPEIAHTAGDLYIENIESCRTMPELLDLSHTMFSDFVHRVHKLKENSDRSKPIQECCDFITMNICKKFTVSSLSSLTGYTDYYLSRKFKKEVGVSINEYIRNAKIEHAKMLLSSTKKSIQEISAELNFCSRSYFTDTFLKVTGMGPKAYRESYGQK